MKKYALIVAGGKGLRMGSAIPKQFILLYGKPVLMHTLSKFSEAVDEVILVLPESQVTYWKALCMHHQFNQPHRIVIGGEFRFDSVKNGLKEIDGKSMVAIHDGVRPIVSAKMIHDVFSKAQEKGNAIAAVRIRESIREKSGLASVARDRENYFLVQTPQAFNTDVIREAYNLFTDGSRFTDDASVLEATGKEIFLVEGDHRNIKITTPEDLKIAEALLNS